MERQILCFACIFAIVFTRSAGGSSMITLIEGEPASLNFIYQCDSTEVTLQHGYKAPFYKIKNSETLLTQNPEGRFIVEDNSESGDNCSLHLIINHVNRNDAGAFICQFHKDGQLLPEYSRIELHVDYPPGKATCEKSENYTLKDWSALSCTAPVGSLPGQIGCFQDSVVSPPVLNPMETDSVLRHVFWVRHIHPVFCCSFRSDHPAERCDCRDFAKVPHENGLSNTTAEPCPVTTTVQPVMCTFTLVQPSPSSQSNTTINSNTRTTNATTNETCSHWYYNFFYRVLYNYAALLVIIIIIIIVTITITYLGREFGRWIDKSESDRTVKSNLTVILTQQ